MTAPANIAPPLTVSARIEGIKANAEHLLRRMPDGWQAWSVDRTRDFKRRVGELRKARSLLQTQSAAHQVAAEYKVPLVQLDPWEGA